MLISLATFSKAHLPGLLEWLVPLLLNGIIIGLLLGKAFFGRGVGVELKDSLQSFFSNYATAVYIAGGGPEY